MAVWAFEAFTKSGQLQTHYDNIKTGIFSSTSCYFNGETAHLSDYIEANHFDEYKDRIQTVKDIINKSKTSKLPLWLGEGADAYHGGTQNVSDRYMSGFL